MNKKQNLDDLLLAEVNVSDLNNEEVCYFFMAIFFKILDTPPGDVTAEYNDRKINAKHKKVLFPKKRQPG